MTKKKEEEIIELKPIKLKEATITIKGTTPLIINNFSEKSRQQIIDAQMKKTKTKELRNPVEDFIRANYWLTEMPTEFTTEAFEKALKKGAKFGFPAKGIKASIVSGAYRNGLTKDKVSLYGAFLIPQEFVEIQYKEITGEECHEKNPFNHIKPLHPAHSLCLLRKRARHREDAGYRLYRNQRGRHSRRT